MDGRPPPSACRARAWAAGDGPATPPLRLRPGYASARRHAPSLRRDASLRRAEPSRRRDHRRPAARTLAAAQAARCWTVPAAGAARRRDAAGTARRPCASQPSSKSENGSPPRWRTRSTDQRARPTPATRSGPDGAHATRHLVAAAEGSTNGSRPARCQRRNSSTGTPASPATSCRRRVAVIEARRISPTTAAGEPSRTASSTTARSSVSSRAST